MADEHAAGGGAVAVETKEEEGAANAASSTASAGLRMHGRLGALTFEGIRVESPGAAAAAPRLARLCAPLKQILQDFFNTGSFANEAFAAVDGVDGYLRPGQLCLLMGPPGCGKSTLLRALAGNLHGKADRLEGRICLGGIQLDSADPVVRRLVNYVGSGDTAHSPVLTVNETFTFASACALPYDAARVASSVERMEKTLGLSHVKNTVVGGEELRGISGGQKRRVSFGEMVFGSEAPIACLDDITNGLDSTSAANVVRAIREACATYGFAAIATLLQPPQEVFEHFDTVLCLTAGGRAAYFGPREGARSYFEAAAGGIKPPEKSDPEYIQEVVSKLVPAETLATRYLESPERKEVLAEIAGLNRARRHESILAQVAARPSQYANGFATQFRLCTWRRGLLVKRNAMTVRRPIVAILFGLVTGTLFWNLPNDLIGTISKSGYTFLSLFLVLMLSAAVTLPENFRQRPVFFKHRGASLYGTMPYYLSTVLLDVPLALVESMLLAGVPYYMVGMRSGVSHFFYFWAILLALEFVGQAWGRFVSAVCPTEVMANVVTTGYIFVCGLVSGYMPGYRGIGWWWRWLSWATPVSYGFEGLMINEYNGRDVNLLIVVDAADGTTEIGSVPGATLISALFSLPRIPYGEGSAGWLDTPVAMKTFDLCMIFAFSVALDIAAVALLDASRRRFGAQTRRHQVHVGSAARTNAADDGAALLAADADSAASTATAVLLTVEDLTYEVALPGGKAAAAAAPVAPSAPAAAAAPEGAGGGGGSSGAPGAGAKDPESAAAPAYDAAEATAAGSEEGAGSSNGSSGDSEVGERGHGQTTASYGQDTRFSFVRAASTMLVSSVGAPKAKKPEAAPVTAAAAVAAGEAPLAAGRLRLLTSVTAEFKGGKMTALMGESGAGKTTLLDVIAGYKTGGHITGGAFINGHPKDGGTWKLLSGYCEQCDIHNPYLSVRESLLFAAKCRLPAAMAAAEKTKAVNRVVALLGLEEHENMLVGREGAGEGLPKHARKRLTIAVELVAGPRILFLDEPTTGLDAVSADIVLSSVRRSADLLRLAVVATIHQPSRALFEMFDALLLLQKGGRVVYSGPIHAADGGRAGSGALVSYFEGLHPSFHMSENENPADFALQVVEGKRTAGVTAQDANARGMYLCSKNCAAAAVAAREAREAPTEVPVTGKRPGFGGQLLLVWPRQALALWRNGSYTATRFLWTIFGAVMVGTVFLQLEEDLLGAVLKIGSIFFAVYVAVVPMQAAVVPLMEERAVLYRETSSGTYSHWAYAFGQLLADIPFHLASATLFMVIFYYLVGLRDGAEFAGYFLLVMALAYWVLPSIGQLMALLSPNVETANGLAGLCIILSTLLMGFLMPVALMPGGWVWAYWANLLHYVLQGLCVNELANRYFPLDLQAVLSSVDLSGMELPVVVLPQGGANMGEMRDFLSEQFRNVVNNTVTDLVGGVQDDIAAAQGKNLLACLIANDCFADDTTVQECVAPGLFNSGPCFSVAVGLATDLPQLLGCFGDGIRSTLECLTPYLLPTEALKRIAEAAAAVVAGLVALKGAAAWVINIANNFEVPDLTLPAIPVPGNVILASFGWADAAVDAGPTGQNVTVEVIGKEISFPGYGVSINWDTGSRYYYCLFSIAMFLLGIEILKIFAVRYVCWIKR